MGELAGQPETGIGTSGAPLGRRLAAEGVGTAFLLIAVVGSGIMAARLTSDVGLRLLANATATGCALVALIWTFGWTSGAHLNPIVTLVDRANGTITTSDAAAYVAAQVAGACVGTVAANVMFDVPALDPSTHVRSSVPLWFSEVLASFGLLVVIHGTARSGRSNIVAVAVGAWIAGAYFFTSSTSFANPAATIGRSLTDTFAGIAASSVPMFIVAQLLGAGLAFAFILLVLPKGPRG